MDHYSWALYRIITISLECRCGASVTTVIIVFTTDRHDTLVVVATLWYEYIRLNLLFSTSRSRTGQHRTHHGLWMLHLFGRSLDVVVVTSWTGLQSYTSVRIHLIETLYSNPQMTSVPGVRPSIILSYLIRLLYNKEWMTRLATGDYSSTNHCTT